MAKEKSKTYKYEPENDAVVLVGEGRPSVSVSGGDTYTTSNVVEQAALDANPDFTEVKGGKRK